MRPWEMELVQVLVSDVDVVSLEQAARSFWRRQQRSIENARRATGRLERNGWLEIRSVFARPVRELRQPLVTWRPGEEPPDFQRLARLLQTRAKVSARSTVVISASQKSRDQFGDGSQRPAVKLTQMTHELHVSEIFLAYRKQGFGNLRWAGERTFAPHWPLPQLPDALLVDEQGHPQRAIEYGGDYPPQRLRRIHESLASVPLPYECW